MRTSRAYATELDDGFAALVTISGSTMIRLTDWGEDLVRGGELYTAEPFQIVLPDAVEDSPPVARLTLDNVNRILVESLRSIEGPIPISLRVVLASNPDTTELGPFDFEIRGARWDTVVSCDLTYEPILSRAVPADVFRPAAFPGLFR